LHTAIVIPCLNEEAILASSCQSLGFGIGGTVPLNATLILVDNGSDDATLEVAKGIAARSPSTTVVVVNEATRGFVPARHRGVITAAAIAAEFGKAEEDVLILQGDADTIYSSDYSAAMNSAALTAGPGVLLKARTLLPDAFIQDFPDYLQLCDTVDAQFGDLLSDHPEDVVIDDKACGFRLSDYLCWGGHQREFTANGDEVYAETTRLYLRGKSLGARAVLVDAATATHSTRRIFEHAGVDLATSGFPRESSWRQHWERALEPIADLRTLLRQPKSALVDTALIWRRRHVLALFGILPLHVARTLKIQSEHESAEWARDLSLPQRSPSTLQSNPALLVYDALKEAELF
jgi:hypothetical protein